MTSRQYRNKTQKRTNRSRRNTTRKSLLFINSITWHPRGISKKSINKKDLPSIMKSNTTMSTHSRARGNQGYLFPPKRELFCHIYSSFLCCIYHFFTFFHGFHGKFLSFFSGFYCCLGNLYFFISFFIAP